MAATASLPLPVSPPPPVSPDQEAAEQAARHWNQLYTVCGNTRFSQIFYGPAYADRQGFQSLSEWSHLTWNLLPRQLSEADRLNHVEWDGTSEVQAAAFRQMLKGQGWQPWVQFDGLTVVRRLVMRKVQGVWQVHEDGVGDKAERPIACREAEDLSAGRSQTSTSSVAEPLYNTAFQSIPNGATVTVDGKKRGVTGPDGMLIVQLTGGYHKAVVSKTGFPDDATEVLVTPNNSAAFLSDLKTRLQGQQSENREKAKALFDQGRYDEAYAICAAVMKIGLEYNCMSINSQIDEMRSRQTQPR